MSYKMPTNVTRRNRANGKDAEARSRPWIAESMTRAFDRYAAAVPCVVAGGWLRSRAVMLVMTAGARFLGVTNDYRIMFGEQSATRASTP